MKGIWWNPDKAGEGFIFAPDGQRVIGYFYTYIGESPGWYLLNLVRDSDAFIAGDVIATSAQPDSEPGSPGTVTEEQVGVCKLVDQGNDTWKISVTINAKSVDYVIGSLFGTGLPPWQPEPPVDPPVDPPEPDPIPKVIRWDKWSDTLNQWFEDVGGSEGSSNPNELYGSSPVDIDDINPRDRVGEYRLTVLDGSVRIVNPGGSGPYNPEVKGVTNGEVFDSGRRTEITLWLGPGEPPPSGWVHSNFIIDADIDGERVRIMTVSSQVAQRAE